MVLLQEVIPSVQGSSPRGLLLVLVVWTSSCRSLVQKISFGCFLLCKTVEPLALFRASGVLLLPVWPKSSFFSYFFPEGRHLPEWVSAVVPVKPTFVAGPLVTSKFFRRVGSWDCLLIQVDFGGFDFSRFFFPKLEPSHCLLKGCEACLIGHF